MAKIKKFDSFVEAGPEMEKVAKVHVQQKQDEAVLAFNKAGKLRIADRYVLFLDKMPVGSAFVNMNNGGMLALRELEVDQALHNKGIGTKFMEQLCDAADANGWTIVLTPDSYKGSSKSRLIAFYKRFGFVANHGRKKDYRIWEAMYRLPENRDNEADI